MWIDFDMVEINRLKVEYEDLKQFIIDELPDVNWNSIQGTKAYFRDEHWLELESVQIAYLQTLVNLEENNPWHDELCGLIELKKISSIIRNYLDCIIRHEKNGRCIVTGKQIGRAHV